MNKGKKTFREEDYLQWLCGIDGIGIRKLMRLREEFASAAEIYHASSERLKRISGISSRDVHNIVESRKRYDPGSWSRLLAGYGMSCVTVFSDGYPEACRQLYQPPKRLFYRGSLPRERVRVAIVGARNCSLYGKEMARFFAVSLAAGGIGVISGMARGIDGWAHQGALEGGGRTYAVLGNSVEICYPAEHERLYRSILGHGGVISEYPPGTKARAGFFPMRNRIIGALSDGVLVVEARKKSGSLITADQALDQGRDVFVVPGRIGDELSEGCNNLIRQGACLVTDPSEILEYYGISAEEQVENLSNFNIFLERKEKMVYANLSLEPKHLSELAEESGMGLTEAMRCILSLQKKQFAEEIGTHYYIKSCRRGQF